ncbi:hypothetical protein SDC9_57297 [bioreactor metagenome]|uniref:Thioester reductase (TE) domain-containing protein n=1 Tax=bioreactor metagenome TaxID=1076179 RepID=A0A644X4J1_9ZZZZ
MHHESDRTVVLTGGTGFLGTFLLSGLLERGYHVTVLGRSSKSLSLSDRLSGIVRWLGTNPEARLSAVEADFSKNHLGLDETTYRHLCASAGKIIHCASDTSFSERDRKRVMQTNVNSLSVLLAFAADTLVDHLYYISSAYACGRCEGICLETPIANDSFTNVYEESKAQAERIIRLRCKDCGIPLSILRPSIVYGHSETGMALNFNALYYVIRSLLYIRDIFIKDIAAHGGERSKKWGFQLDDAGILYMPLDIYLPSGGTVNLIPVDYFVDSTISIMEHAGMDGIYHLTNDHPPDMSTLIEYTQRFLRLRGVRAICDISQKTTPNPAEELFDHFIDPYRPYLSDRRTFDRSRTKTVPGCIDSPPLTYEVFERCMAYALASNWGKAVGFPK